MTGLAASATALAVLSTPVGLIELVVTSTGLSESIPAAAPPLGSTARALLAVFAALMATGITLSFQNNSYRADKAADGDRKMGFALSRFTAFARGRGRDVADDMPVLRRADAHPDAPARRPIFASRDFRDVEIFRPAIAAMTPAMAASAPFCVEEDRDPVVDGTGLAMPRAPEPLPDAEILAFAGPRIALAPIAEGMAAPRIAPALAVSDAPEIDGSGSEQPACLSADAFPADALPVAIPAPVVLASHDASVADLAARFERGLARRIALAEAARAASHAETVLARTADTVTPPISADTVLADIPAAEPVPVRADVDRDIEQALRAALGTLHKMTTRAL